jgi:hypothetical protein
MNASEARELQAKNTQTNKYERYVLDNIKSAARIGCGSVVVELIINEICFQEDVRLLSELEEKLKEEGYFVTKEVIENVLLGHTLETIAKINISWEQR